MIFFLRSTYLYSPTFVSIRKKIFKNRGVDDYFGYSVSISGNYAIVGAYTKDEDVSGKNTAAAVGSAYIFKKMLMVIGAKYLKYPELYKEKKKFYP